MAASDSDPPDTPLRSPGLPTRRLGRAGPELPVLGLGTWRRFDLPPRREHLAHQVVEHALDLGVRAFDTAPVYGRAEQVLANALRSRRAEAFVATKIWAGDAGEGRRQLDRQLQLFGGRVDLLQIHHLIGWRNHLDWLAEAREQGLIRLIGVSFWQDGAFGGGTTSDLRAAIRSGVIDVVQVPVNPLERRMEDRVLPLAKEHGTGVIAMRPFAEGALLPGPAPDRLAETGSPDYAHALLRWTLGDPRVHLAIPATLDPAHLDANAAAVRAAPLTGEQRHAIARLARRSG